MQDMSTGAEALTAIGDAIGRARQYSPFLSNGLRRNARIESLLVRGEFSAALCSVRDIQCATLAETLRRQREALSLVLAVADLAGTLPFEQVSQELSDFADHSLDLAIADAIEKRTPGEEARGFAVIALGKHGGRELNYSSDIDPIFIYDREQLPTHRRDDPGEAAQRIARHVVELLGKRDENGFVFRVDLRLRPASEASPLSIPVEVALSHYESSALTWEQAAFIRSRAASGDARLGQSFLDDIRPFIWRRSLDFGAIQEIAELTDQIRDHYSEGQRLGPGYDIKRGRGGIREIEFFAQIHQLIHGGRNPDLRAGATLDALAALANARVLDPEEAGILSDHYRLLRTIEHRLQMVDDRQTHHLPDDGAALDDVAKLHALEHGEELVALLQPVVKDVADRYDRLVNSFGQRSGRNSLSRDEDVLAGQLTEFGFAEEDGTLGKLLRWRGGAVRSIRSSAARRAFEELLPLLMQAIAKAPDRARALNRFDDFLRKLPSGINFFNLLQARPGLLDWLVDILIHAPPLADALALRSDLFDGLIDQSALLSVGSVDQLKNSMAQLEPGEGYEQLLDNVRRKVGELRFLVGARLVEGQQDTLDGSADYARIAEAALAVLTDATIAEFEAKHGKVPGGELVILALGRQGGGALTHASDLDLVFLFTGHHQAESDGKRSLGATTYFNRLAQRVVAAMSVPTANGALYEVDTRLRPSGAQGPLCVTFDSFKRYQFESAWTWEHMALCRARPIYGSAQAQEQLGAIIASALAKVSDDEAMTNAVLQMRGNMARHKPPKGPLDVKLLPGGLVDVEFLVHHQQLGNYSTLFAKEQLGLPLSPDLVQAVPGLAAAGLLSQELLSAYKFLAKLLIIVRLVSPDCADVPEESRHIVSRACGVADWSALKARLEEARQLVLDEWLRIFDVDRHQITAQHMPKESR